MPKRQHTGKGRQGRAWESIDGNFLGSTIVRMRAGDPSAPALTLVAGLSLIEAVEIVAPGAQLSLKWPNDLMLGDASWLSPSGAIGDRVVAGFGVNLAGSPDIPGRKTAALGPLVEIAPEAFAPLLAGKFAQILAMWRYAEPAQFAQAWMTSSPFRWNSTKSS